MKARTVAVYARVSTEHEAQLSALENQEQYYQNILDNHPEWKLYKVYIDKGITGTSVKKRKMFLEMMSDAASKKFDLIITREVSRFARNTVDTLQETRKLKKLGVEVYFTEDNIWTMNDDDGELRLTIMATLAQNESKKTSVRVKAGQMISFQNAVPYGTGNILGYKRVNHEMIVDPDQAATVRMIFEMYLNGMGQRKIQFELERLGRLTSTGNKRWHASYISRVLHNPFYCGTIVYRKEFVPDYLEQKKIKNHDMVDKVVVEGKHQPLISKEDFAKVQEILDSKTESVNNRGPKGLHTSNDLWVRKLVCSCGSRFKRSVWHRTKDCIQYAYQCIKQVKSGSIATRRNKGLSIEGICPVRMVPKWKLELMASCIFKDMWNHKSEVIKIANEILEKHIKDDLDEDFKEEIEQLEKQLKETKRKLSNLLDLRLSDDISKELYVERKDILDNNVEYLENKLNSFRTEQLDDSELEDKLNILRYGIEQDFSFDSCTIPETVIDAFVNKVIVTEDSFIWHLSFDDRCVKCIVTGQKPRSGVALVKTSEIDITEGASETSSKCSLPHRLLLQTGASRI